MKSLYTNLQYSMPPHRMKLTDEEKDKLVRLDAEYGRLQKLFRFSWNYNHPTNVDEQYDQFIEAYNNGIEFYPIFKTDKDIAALRECKDGFMRLASEFQKFNCFLSKYYIQRCLEFSRRAAFAINPKEHALWFVEKMNQTPTQEETAIAKKLLQEHPYKKPDKAARNINAERALKFCKKKMEKYDGFKVQIKQDMMPRMGVSTKELSLNISANAMFSDIDLAGLNAHEIRGHVARRYYAAKTGLWLMVFGLDEANDFDEGIAVYNSLHRVKIRKPNILFNISMKTYVASMIPNKSFYEIFDICHKEFPAIDTKVLFKTISRFKRELGDCSLLGGNGDDQSYLCGYLKVKDMTQKQRDELIRYNIGPKQLAELDDIKEFFAVNKFKPLI